MITGGLPGIIDIDDCTTLVPAEAVMVTVCCAAVDSARTWKLILVWPVLTETVAGAVAAALLVMIVIAKDPTAGA